MEKKIEIYKSDDNNTEISVQFEKETVWLSQEQLVVLFSRDQSVIPRHTNNIFKEEELEKESNMYFLHIANLNKPRNINFSSSIPSVSLS